MLKNLIVELIVSLYVLRHSDLKRNKLLCLCCLLLSGVLVQCTLNHFFYYSGTWEMTKIITKYFVLWIFGKLEDQSMGSHNIIFLFMLNGLYHLGEELFILGANMKYGILPLQIEKFFEHYLSVSGVLVLAAGGLIVMRLMRSDRNSSGKYGDFFVLVFLMSFMIRVHVESIMYRENVYLLRLLLINFFLYIMVFILYYLYYRTIKDNEEAIQRKYMFTQLTGMQTYANTIAQQEKEIRMIRHDLKNQLTIYLWQLQNGEAEKAQKHMQEQLDYFDSIVVSGSTSITPIDAVLAAKTENAKEKNIRMHTVVQVGKLTEEEGYDVAMILGNLLDNAIENIHAEKREINLSIRHEEKLMIRVDNPTLNTNMISRKKDKRNHGLGLRSVESIVKKHQGFLITNMQGNVFTAYVEMTLHK